MTDKKTYKLLKKMYKAETMTQNEVTVFTKHSNPNTLNRITSFLLTDKLIEYIQESYEKDENGTYKEGAGYYRITILGRAYVEQRRRNLLSFLIPYSITTLIALAGLLLALQDIGPRVICSCCLG